MPLVCFNYFLLVFSFPFLLLIPVLRNVHLHYWIIVFNSALKKVGWDTRNHKFIFLSTVTILLQF